MRVNQERIDFTVRIDSVTDELIIRRCCSLTDAIRLCRECSADKDEFIIDEVCKLSGREKTILPSHFSEMMAGRRAFPPDLIQPLEDVCSNYIPTRYMALTRNQELKPKRQAWELKAEAEKKRADEAEAKLRTIQDFFKGMPVKM